MLFSRIRGLSDADLVARVAQKDEAAFTEILARHQDAIYSFARRVLADDQEAEDASQETFLRFYKAAPGISPTAALRTYLLKILKNICIDIYRKKKPDLLEDLPEQPDTRTPQVLLEGAVAILRLEEAIEGLPVNQKTAILLRHTEHLSYSEISEIMGVSLSAVESLLVRARKFLRHALTQPDRVSDLP